MYIYICITNTLIAWYTIKTIFIVSKWNIWFKMGAFSKLELGDTSAQFIYIFNYSTYICNFRACVLFTRSNKSRWLKFYLDGRQRSKSFNKLKKIIYNKKTEFKTFNGKATNSFSFVFHLLVYKRVELFIFLLI